MNRLDLNKVQDFVEQNIGEFHDRRLGKIKSLKLNNILKRKNPYLFRAKNLLTSHDLIKSITDAYISSSEEGLLVIGLKNLQFT